MIIGVPREIKPGEYRVGMLPVGAELLTGDGHTVLVQRGAGLGRLTLELMLEKAFLNERARIVSLVVFPDNTTAIRCYRTTGFRHIGEQVKYFPSTRRQHCMLEMRMTRKEYLLIREQKAQA